MARFLVEYRQVWSNHWVSYMRFHQPSGAYNEISNHRYNLGLNGYSTEEIVWRIRVRPLDGQLAA